MLLSDSGCLKADPSEKEPMAEPQARPPTQLYLITPPVSEGTEFLPVLKEVLGVGEAACVLLNIVVGDDHAAKKIIKDFAAVVQPTGAALIVSGWSAVIARGGADGDRKSTR